MGPEGVRGVNHLAFGNGRDRIYHRSALCGRRHGREFKTFVFPGRYDRNEDAATLPPRRMADFTDWHVMRQAHGVEVKKFAPRKGLDFDIGRQQDSPDSRRDYRPPTAESSLGGKAQRCKNVH
jgi:hypothetical protein